MAGGGPSRIVSALPAMIWALIVVAVALPLLAPPPAIAAAGAVREFRVPTADAHPGGIAIGPDGAVWFTEIATGAIGRRGPEGVDTYRLPHGGNPNAIVVGPDGALWFTEYSADRIGRITTSGRITEFPIGSCGGCGPWDMTAGPDGALWFTEYEVPAIGRITTAGRVEQFPLGRSEGHATSIAAGPDGALWFGDEYGIGRITTGGGVSQPWRGAGYAEGITTGPDGNLWFTGGAQDALGRLNPATGKAKFFPLGSNCDPQQVAAGAGALWATCYFEDAVKRITTAGVLTSFPVPNHFRGTYPDTLEGITAGGDHAMWFTEEAADRIGRISTT